MNNKTRTLFFFVFAVIALTACRKKAFDEYYGRPESLESPIYQSLTARGNFKSLLAAIDKSGYKQTLSGAGYWTFFAPNDSAFTVYFREKGVSGIEQLDSNACRQIVTYCLVYNAFKKDRIDDYQSALGWVPNNAFRRRTANYTGVYNDTNINRQPIKAIASNRNGSLNFYIEADQNNKYIPIFTDTFFRTNAISAADYNYFYPNTPFTGFNVADARVLKQDIPAENGIIHEVGRVITALPSIDEYITSKPEYSEFKKLFDKYLVQYVLNQSVTLRYNNQGNSGQVYTKVFNSAVGYSPNNENYLKFQDNDGQTSGYSIFVPTNTALRNYINTTLLENYSSLDAMPIGVIYDFVNAHLWQSTVWPSKFNGTLNVQGEPARFNAATDVIDKKILSNGVFYGTNKVQQANVFTTVFGRAYLDPKYTTMQELMGPEIRRVITNPNDRYTIFMMSNAAIAAAGYTQNQLLSADLTLQWEYRLPGTTAVVVSGTTAYQRLLRLLNMHVVYTPTNALDNLGGSGVAQTFGGDYIKWNNNQVQGAGNVDSNTVVRIDSFKTSSNGRVYYVNRLITYSETPLGKHIEKLQYTTGTTRSQYWHFAQLLINSASFLSPLYNTGTGDITGLNAGAFYTVFVPDSNSIKRAVVDGVLPGTVVGGIGVPNFAPTIAADQARIAAFIQYHIIDKAAIGTDGAVANPDGLQGRVPTLLITANGPIEVFVNRSAVGSLALTDFAQRAAATRLSPPANGDYLSNRAVIHSINNYLKYY